MVDHAGASCGEALCQRAIRPDAIESVTYGWLSALVFVSWDWRSVGLFFNLARQCLGRAEGRAGGME